MIVPTDPVVLIFIAVALAILVALVTAVLVRGRDGARRERDGAQRAALEARRDELIAERDSARERVEILARENAELRTRAAVDAERLQWLSSAERSLRETFESLAARALQQSAGTLMEQSRQQLDHFAQLLRTDWGAQKQELSGLVYPLNDELKKLDAQVRAMEEKRQGAYQGINDQIRLITEQYRSLQQATTSLDQALRSSTVRGTWGEVQLRRLVEMAGMTAHVDFDEQVVTGNAASRAGGDGESGTGNGRPDMVVYLPSGGIMPVDAKAPMSAYLDSHEAGSPELIKQALKRHAAALRGHVQSLSQKAYWSQFSRAPEFVVLLIPYESGLAAAFGADPGLLEYALANKVVITAPASFLALLRVVGYGWMQLSISENAEAIAGTGRELLDRLRPFSEHLNKVGSALSQAVGRFNDAAGSFERRVLPTARKLQELGTASESPPTIDPIDVSTRELPEQL